MSTAGYCVAAEPMTGPSGLHELRTGCQVHFLLTDGECLDDKACVKAILDQTYKPSLRQGGWGRGGGALKSYRLWL